MRPVRNGCTALAKKQKQKKLVQHVETIAGNPIPCHTVKLTIQIQHFAENYGTKPLKVNGPLLKGRKENPYSYC